MKKQFRLYDLYRYAATGEQSKIKGIHSYECNATATTITIRFTNQYDLDDDKLSIIRFADTEKERREVVREVNKRLNNCDTPGPKKNQLRYKQMCIQFGKEN